MNNEEILQNIAQFGPCAGGKVSGKGGIGRAHPKGIGGGGANATRRKARRAIRRLSTNRRRRHGIGRPHRHGIGRAH